MSLSADTGISPDLLLVAKGGDAFAERLTQLDAAKSEAVAAFEALRIGNDAKAAWDEANAAKAEIKAKREKAQADIDEMLQIARAQCDTMRYEAGLVVADAAQRAKEMAAEAEAALADAKAEAAQIVKDAKAKAMEAGRKAKAAEEAKAIYEEQTAAAEAAIAAAQASQAKYDALVKKLMDHITDTLMAEQQPEAPDAQ